MFNFSFFDIQAFEKRLYQRKNPSGLDHLIDQYGLKSYTYHESDDDAFMTMEVFKKLLEQNNMTVNEAIEKYKDAYGDIPMFLEDAEKRRKVKEAKRKKSKEIDNFYIEVNSVYPSLDSYDERYYKKNVCFNYLLFEDDFSCLYEFGKELRKKGATIVRNPLDADYIIIRPHTVLSNTTKTKENVQIIRLDTLRKQLKKE